MNKGWGVQGMTARAVGHPFVTLTRPKLNSGWRIVDQKADPPITQVVKVYLFSSSYASHWAGQKVPLVFPVK